jgi:hypothetical protein
MPAMTEAVRKPFMPPSRSERDADWKRGFIRAATGIVLSKIRKDAGSPEQLVRANWPMDRTAAELIVRAPVRPAEVGDYPGGTVAKLMLLAPRSLAAQLLPQAMTVDLKGVTQFSFPLPTIYNAAQFVAEGVPIAVRQGNFTGMMIGPVKKIALIAGLSNELESASGNIAETIIGYTLDVAVGRGLDTVLLSANAATADAPSGLLNGITPLVPTAGAGVAAMVSDLKNLIGAIAANNIDTSSVVFIAAAVEAMAIKLQAGPHFDYPVLASNVLPVGTVIALVTGALVIAGDGAIPQIDTSKQATLHFAEPASPIVSTSGVVAAPTQSTFQDDTLALRCIARITWSAAPGSVAVVNSVTW